MSNFEGGRESASINCHCSQKKLIIVVPKFILSIAQNMPTPTHHTHQTHSPLYLIPYTFIHLYLIPFHPQYRNFPLTQSPNTITLPSESPAPAHLPQSPPTLYPGSPPIPCRSHIDLRFEPGSGWKTPTRSTRNFRYSPPRKH